MDEDDKVKEQVGYLMFLSVRFFQDLKLDHLYSGLERATIHGDNRFGQWDKCPVLIYPAKRLW